MKEYRTKKGHMTHITFEKWEEKKVSEYTVEYNGQANPIVRDVYSFPNGIKVYHEVMFPWNPLRPQTEAAIIDFMLPVTTKGIRLDTQRYTPDGFGLPMFTGEDALRQAFDYALKLKG